MTPKLKPAAKKVVAKKGEIQGTKKDTKKEESRLVVAQTGGDREGRKQIPMDAGDLKRFLSHMGYHSKTGGDPDATKILAAYNAGSADEKRGLLAKFKVNGKDLKWARTMSTTTSDSTTTDTGCVRDWYFRTDALF